MKILVIEHFAGNLDGKDNDRFVYLCKMLAANPDNKVELITSSFNHEKKCKKEIPEFKKNNEFQQIIDSITDNLDYCYVRKFYPGKESSGSTKMYSDRAFEYIKSQYNKN